MHSWGEKRKRGSSLFKNSFVVNYKNDIIENYKKQIIILKKKIKNYENHMIKNKTVINKNKFVKIVLHELNKNNDPFNSPKKKS